MKLRKLNLEELRWLHDVEMTEAFPPEELKPYAAMENLCKSGMYHPMGAYEGDDLVGYALLWESPGGKYVLIDYLGVTAARRNGGLGGKILALLKETFHDWDGIIVESEAPDGGEHDALRNRRMDFYRRNGFTFLDYDCILFGVHYGVCLCSPNGKGREEDVMQAHINLYRHQLTQWAYDRFVQIPRDPENPLQPPESWADQVDLPGMEIERKGNG